MSHLDLGFLLPETYTLNPIRDLGLITCKEPSPPSVLRFVLFFFEVRPTVGTKQSTIMLPGWLSTNCRLNRKPGPRTGQGLTQAC